MCGNIYIDGISDIQQQWQIIPFLFEHNFPVLPSALSICETYLLLGYATRAPSSNTAAWEVSFCSIISLFALYHFPFGGWQQPSHSRKSQPSSFSKFFLVSLMLSFPSPYGGTIISSDFWNRVIKVINFIPPGKIRTKHLINWAHFLGRVCKYT